MYVCIITGETFLYLLVVPAKKYMNSLLYFSLKINNAMSGVLAYSVGQDLYRNNYILGKSTVLLNSTVETQYLAA